MKYYFLNLDSETAYSELSFQNMMRDEKLTEIKVLEAVRMKSSDIEFMWCKFHSLVGEKGGCGKQCEQYSPYNGISGMCRNQGILFEHGEEVTLKLKP